MTSVFDSPRSERGRRHVQCQRVVSMRVDETDGWIDVPVRSVFVDDGLTGWTFEIGPYSVCGSDATKLINALAEYGELSGEFIRKGDAV